MTDRPGTRRGLQPVSDYPAPGYPRDAELPATDPGVDQARRRLLKLLGLSAAAAMLGLNLTGCPGGGGGGGKMVEDIWDWMPWNDEFDDDDMIAGAMPMPMGRPVSVVVGGGPVSVTFSDGTSAKLVVAAVLVAEEYVITSCAEKAEGDAKIVQDAMAAVGPEVLGDAEALAELEEKVRVALEARTGAMVETVSIAVAAEKPKELGQAREAASESADMGMAAASAPAAPAAEDPAASPTVSLGAGNTAKPKSETIWTVCRRPGCTRCGAK